MKTIIKQAYPNFFTTSDNIKLFFNTNFKKENLGKNEIVIVFNYGLVCNVQHFKYQIKYFNDLGYKILTYDYRFHYASSSTKNVRDCTFKSMTNDLYELINHLNITNTYQVGHSMGVNIALEFAKMYPKLVNKMVLISGTVLPPQNVMFDTGIIEYVTPVVHFLSNQFPKEFKMFWENGRHNPIIREVIFRGGFNTKKVHRDFVKYYMKKIAELSHELFLQLMDEMKNHQILNDLKMINNKTLVIGGDKDGVIPHYIQKIISNELPNAEEYIVKNGSHVPQIDFPIFINERINIFFE